MRSRLPLALTVVVVVFLSAARIGRAQAVRSGPQVGRELPGPFQALAVVGEGAGRFRCPVCDNGLRASILVFVRFPETPDAAIVSLLKGMDALVEANAADRVRAFAVFLGDSSYKDAIEAKIDENSKVTDLNLTRAIITKDERVAALKSLAKDAGLRHVDISLAPAEGPPQYGINRDAEVTVILYYKLKVVANYAYPAGQFTPAEAEKTVRNLKTALARLTQPSSPSK
jgi:hypothetical protein